MKVLAWYTNPNGIENINIVKYLCPNGIEKLDILIVIQNSLGRK
jgi:hypothetical protein